MRAARPAMARGPLHRLGAAAGLSAFALAGCVAPQDDLDRIGAAMAIPSHQVVVDGQTYVVQIEGRGTGTMLTAGGARPVQGQLLRVMGTAAPLSQDQGAVAKRAARSGCVAESGRFNETALGNYEPAARQWVFAGACA